MRFFDETITLPPGAPGSIAPHHAAPHDAASPHHPIEPAAPGHKPSRLRRTTARQGQGRRAEMSPATFCLLVSVWAGAVLLVLLIALALRLLG